VLAGEISQHAPCYFINDVRAACLIYFSDGHAERRQYETVGAVDHNN
jgi:hypothetical protein